MTEDESFVPPTTSTSLSDFVLVPLTSTTRLTTANQVSPYNLVPLRPSRRPGPPIRSRAKRARNQTLVHGPSPATVSNLDRLINSDRKSPPTKGDPGTTSKPTNAPIIIDLVSDSDEEERGASQEPPTPFARSQEMKIEESQVSHLSKGEEPLPAAKETDQSRAEFKTAKLQGVYSTKGVIPQTELRFLVSETDINQPESRLLERLKRTGEHQASAAGTSAGSGWSLTSSWDFTHLGRTRLIYLLSLTEEAGQAYDDSLNPKSLSWILAFVLNTGIQEFPISKISLKKLNQACDSGIYFLYGPDLQNIPETEGLEIAHTVARELPTFQSPISRLTQLRLLSLTRLGGDISHGALLQNSETLIPSSDMAMACRGSFAAVRTDHRVHISTPMRPGDRDQITARVMIPFAPTNPSLAIEASSSKDGIQSLYIIQTLPCRRVFFPQDSFPGVDSTITSTVGFAHIHSFFSAPGWALTPLTLQRCLFGAATGHQTARQFGLYAHYSTLGSSPPRTVTMLLSQLFEAITTESRSIVSTGAPSVSGFMRGLKPYPGSDPDRLPSPLCFGSTVLLTSGKESAITRPATGHYIVAIGPREPYPHGPAQPPFLHSESPLHFNLILKTLAALRASPLLSISGSMRTFGRASVLEQIHAALPGRLGAVMLCSRIIDMADPKLREMSEKYICQRYLWVSTQQIFLVVGTIDDPTSVDPGHHTHPLDFVTETANSLGCIANVLGQTVSQSGLHFINDVLDPLDPLEPLTVQEAAFVLHPTKFSDIRFERHPLPPSDIGFSFDPMELDRLEEGLAGESQMSSTQEYLAFHDVGATVLRILEHPTVGGKTHIVRHIDRCSNGCILQQQGIGPFDLPLSDYSVVLDSSIHPARLEHGSDVITPLGGGKAVEALLQDMASWFHPSNFSHTFEALAAYNPPDGRVIALGEQAYKLMREPQHGVHYAIAEALTNLCTGPIDTLEDVQVSVAACWDRWDMPSLDRALIAAREFCRGLGVDLTVCDAVTSGDPTSGPSDEAGLLTNSLVFTATAPYSPSAGRLTPELQGEGTTLLAILLHHRPTLRGSCFEYVAEDTISAPEPLNADQLANLFKLVRTLITADLITAAHDISDGGLITSVLEMCLCASRGANITCPGGRHPLEFLLSETPGVIVETDEGHVQEIFDRSREVGCHCVNVATIGREGRTETIIIQQGSDVLWVTDLIQIGIAWESSAMAYYDANLAPRRRGRADEVRYGNYSLDLGHLGHLCQTRKIKLFSSPSPPPLVGLITFPAAKEPVALASAFANAGFSITFITLAALLDEENTILQSLAGIGIAGTTGHLDDRAGAKASILPLLAQGPLKRMRAFLRRRHVFSIACGDAGCTLLFELGAVDAEDEGGLAPRSPSKKPLPWAQIQTEPSISGLFESRWMTVHVTKTHRSHFLAPLRNLTIPCWIQGHAPGFAFRQSGIESILERDGQIAARLQRTSEEDLRSGATPPYPESLTDVTNITAICSKNGRHLCLAFDPSLSVHPWQWLHIPANLKGLQTSPWALCFQCLYLNSLKTRHSL